MNLNTWIRQIHRGLAIAFTAGVIFNTVVIFSLKPAQTPFWVYLFALAPLWLLLLSGLYLFALPYVVAWRKDRRALAHGGAQS